MARAIALKATTAPGRQEGYVVEKTVSPRFGWRTDVMIVQFLLFQYFASAMATENDRYKFAQIYMPAIDSKKRWDDGIYGARTLAAVRLFRASEQTSPKTDAFKELGGLEPLMGWTARSNMEVLNIAFERQFYGDVKTKRRVIANDANPALRHDLFPNGIYDFSNWPAELPDSAAKLSVTGQR